MPQDSPRIPPVEPNEWTDEIREIFTILEGEEARELGTTSNVILTFAHHTELAAAFLKFNKYLFNSKIPPREREIVILRVAWRHQSDYEWTNHVALGKSSGLSDTEIEAIKVGAEAGTWSDADRHLLRATDEFCAGGKIHDDSWSALSAHLDRQQLMDLLFTIGTYSMLASIFRALEVQLEPTVPSLLG